MNQGNEASSSNPSRPENSKAVVESIDFLLDESKQVRAVVHRGKSLETLVFYSRVINTAFEALKTMVDRFNAMPPSSEAEQIANRCKEACGVNKEVRLMLASVMQTISSTSNTEGGHKRVLMWKKQCGKNIERIESLIKDAFSREFLTWFDAFAFHGMFHGFAGVLACLYNVLGARETSDDQNLQSYAEVILETFEKTYRDIVRGENVKIIQGINLKKDQLQLQESNLKSSPKEEEAEASEKVQEQTTVTQKNMQEEEMRQKIIQEEEVQKNSQEAEINKKLQEAETHEQSQEDEALKKIQEDDALKKLEEGEALNELHLVEETQKKLQKDNEMRNLPEEEALKNSQEVDIRNKLQEEEEETLKKIQEEKTRKNSQETDVDKKLQEEEEELKKSQAEEKENTGDKIFKFGNLTFKMKNGAMERVVE